MAINGINEKILFKKGGNSVDGVSKVTTNPYLLKPEDLKRKENQGVLVIDPNKVVNQYNEIVDRYVKQEDLVIYASLKVYKRPQSAVVNSGGNTRRQENISEAININFLNPLKNEKRADGSYRNKGKFTSEWTDFFTSDSANDKQNSDYLLDPETFGITNISIRINASNLPLITIQFTDVQGRVLFERGNEKDNPYNIFYTYPYPKFLLTYKGYYGKAVEVPLVLLKSNTRFDPSTGNYNITAEFQSEIFALFNTFLIIYAYVAPYMYQLEDGSFLGKKILTSLYDKQNQKIKESVNNNIQQYENYIINTYPTLFDLAEALKKIPADVINTIRTDEAIDYNEILLKEKNVLENYDPSVRNFISNSPDNYKIVTSENNIILYQPIPEEGGSFVVVEQNESPTQLFQYLNTMNEAIKNIANIKTSSGGETTFANDLINEIKQVQFTNNPESDPNSLLFKKYTSTKNFKIDKILTLDIFLYNGTDAKDIKNVVFLDNYNEMMSIVFKNISKLQATVEENFITEQINNIGITLGYKPNMSNILRILSNNMQTFLILLDITGRSALRQLETNTQRINIQKKFSDYKKEFGNIIHTPFPNYYKTKTEYINGKSTERVTLAYPGNETINNEWFEVNFVEEIYKALDRIKAFASPQKTGVKQSNPTNILSLFQLGEPDLAVYPSKETSRILGELYSKYSLFSAYSGLPYRSITNFGSNVAQKLAEFEIVGVTKNVFDKMASDQNKFVIANDLARATRTLTEDGVNYTNVGNFGLKYIKFGDGTVENAKSVLKPIFTELSNYTSNTYTQSNYNASISKLNNVLKSPANRDDGTGKLIGVGNNFLYDKITYKLTNNNINLYSIHSDQKPTEIKHYIDLKPNTNYYCDLKIDLIVNSVDNEKYKDKPTFLKGNNNVFGGFYASMNENLKNISINSDLSRSLNYARSEDLPSLTFNTITDDYISMGEYQPFFRITKPIEDFTTTFNI